MIEIITKLKNESQKLKCDFHEHKDESRNSLKFKEKKPEKTRKLDFARYKRRHIALKLLYLGWNYQGFSTQIDTDQTIEYYIFQALLKTNLIESRQTSNYHRCGRTDKGVSSFGQVISLDVRTNLTEGLGIFTPSDYNHSNPIPKKSQEIDYCGLLNRVLPRQIRVIAWAPVETNFSSRFSCQSRVYKYFFPRGSLNISQMHKAGQYLIGTHDFNNFCKKDRAKAEVNTIRTIISVDIKPLKCDTKDEVKGYQIYELTIVGKSFLWHQIRYIMAVLFLVGEGREKADVVLKLLDTSQILSRPQYCLASPLPLILFNCEYNSDDISDWNYYQESLAFLIKQLQSLWTEEVIKSNLILTMIENLAEKVPFNVLSQHSSLSCEPIAKVYKHILDRPQSGEFKLKLTND